MLAALMPSSTVTHPPTSTVDVIRGEHGLVVVRTTAAEFRIGRGGCIEAALLAGTGQLSLDVADDPGDCGSSVVIDGNATSGLILDLERARISDVKTVDGGPGRRIEISGRLASENVFSVEVTATLTALDSSPHAVSTVLAYRNSGKEALTLERVSLPERRLHASPEPASSPYTLWSFHGSSEQVGRDEVVPLVPGFLRANTLGSPGHRGVGGGIPVVAFWSASVGTALGHLEPAGLAASLPVEVTSDGRVHATVRVDPRARLRPGEVFETPRLFHAVFAGDYYEALRIYASLLEATGQPPQAPSPGSYQPSWCSWGFGEDVTADRMLGVLPKLQDLGIRWATLDDRWFDASGDWGPRSDAFGGDSIQRVVEAYHARGVKLNIWWIPLAVETGRQLPRGTRQPTADVALQHPEWLVLDESGLPAHTVRGMSILCPAVPEVREHHRRLVRRFIGEWGFDGHKLDAVFTVPRCHNVQHRHRSPDDSLSALGALYADILSETRALNQDAVVQICPCGTAPHHAWLPFLTQAVAADPWGSAQRRQRIKMYKGLLGPSAAVSGDHVELSERRPTSENESQRGSDFASTVGLGGVLATRFVWPQGPAGSEDVLLTQGKEALFKKWLALDKRTRLSEGTFRNLYVHGFNNPEAYCIEKDGKLYYAFFTADPADVFHGPLELRGLGAHRYRVDDYVSGRHLGVVEGPQGRLEARFPGYLLLVATAESSRCWPFPCWS